MPLSDIMYETPHHACNQNIDGGQPSLMCDKVKDVLVAADWSLITFTSATAQIFYPFGFPVDPPGLTPLGHLAMRIDSLLFIWYVSGDPVPSGVDVIPVLVDATAVGSANNLATAVSSTLVWTAVVDYTAGVPSGLTITSNQAGTAGNGYLFKGNGSTSDGSGLSVGGGWVLRSVSQVFVEGVGTNTGVVDLTIKTKAVGGLPAGGVACNVIWNAAGLAKDQILSNNVTRYRCVGCDCACWISTDEAPLDFKERNVFVGVAHTPDGFTASSYILNGTRLRETLGISGGTEAMTLYSQGPYSASVTSEYALGGFSFSTYHYQWPYGITEKSSSKQLEVPALMIAPDGAAGIKWMGHMWNCFILTEYYPYWQLMEIEGKKFRVIASQSSMLRTSLLVLTGN